MLSALVQDVHFAGRVVRRSPLFTAAVVVTLALGIGLNTAVFSVVESLLLRPLPAVARSQEIVQLYRTYPGERTGSIAVPDYFDLRARTRDVFVDVAAWTFATLNVTLDGAPRYAHGQMVSAGYFSLLGVTARLGRTFRPEEDTVPMAHPVAVLSHAGWQELFGGDPGVVGRRVTVNGSPMEVIGVLPPAFQGTMPIIPPQLYVPLMQLDQARPDQRGALERRGSRFMTGLARLAPGVTVAQAAARLELVMAGLRTEYPGEYDDVGINIIRQADAGIHPSLRDAQVGLTVAVMSVVAVLLLVACVNVANLFLARARDREREMAVRLSIGASRGALLRQLLVESLAYSMLSAVAGLLVARWAMALVNGIRLPAGLPARPDLQLNAPVLLFTVGVAALTPLLFGLGPALRSTRPSLVPALKGASRGASRRSRTDGALVVAQVALSLVLLSCAGFFLVNVRQATRIERGFRGERLVLGSINPALQGYDRARTRELHRRLEELLRRDHEVTQVAFTSHVPLGIGNADREISVPGYTPARTEHMSVQYAAVSPDYFAAMQIDLSRGRGFTAQDDSSAARVIVVNQRFAERFWPGQDPVGRTVLMPGGADGSPHTVVGVVPTGKYRSLGEDPTAFMYFPLAQLWRPTLDVVVAVTGDPAGYLERLPAAVRRLDPHLPLANVRTMERHLGISRLPARITAAALAGFGALGLLLTSVGMYGMMAYRVAQRRREIGIRMAIGASARSVTWLNVREALALVGIGTVLGIAAAVLSARLLRGVLYASEGAHALVLTTVPVVLLLVAGLASWLPSRRAARRDPLPALRAD